MLLLMTVLSVIAILSVAARTTGNSIASWLACGLLASLFWLALNTYIHLSVRPLLSGLPRTTDRISRADIFRARARAMSLKALIFVTLNFAVGTASLVFGALMSITLPPAKMFPDPGWKFQIQMMSVAIFTLLLIMFLWMLIVKIRANQSPI
jgi:hypothetical protein